MYPNAMIHSFEPICSAFEMLTESRADDRLFQAHRIALGEDDASVEIYQNGQTDFSSMLPMNSSCRYNFHCRK